MIKWFAMAALMAASSASARDSLGVYENWAAFRDAAVPRCYAIAAVSGRGTSDGYASIGTWPKANLRGQFHLRLSRAAGSSGTALLAIGRRSFDLVTKGADAWAKDESTNAAIIAAMRQGERMRVRASDTGGRRFTDRYSLEGAATAMDAATVGCAKV